MTELETELRTAWSQRRRAQQHARGDNGEYYKRVLAQWHQYIRRLVARIRAERIINMPLLPLPPGIQDDVPIPNEAISLGIPAELLEGWNNAE